MENNENPTTSTDSAAATPPSETGTQLVPAHQGSLELLDARWDLGSGRTAKFRIVENGQRLIEHPFAKFVMRRGGRVGTRFQAAFIRVGDGTPWWRGETMLAGGGNPLQAGMWVKFWFPDDDLDHPFSGCMARKKDEPGDLFDVVFVEIDDDESVIDEKERANAEKGQREQRLAQYAALLGTNELFLQWLSETVLMPDNKTREKEWWRAEDHIARWIRWICQIESRAELDRNAEAAQRFHDRVREPYRKWSHTKED
jgi:hypothetical protein